MTRSREKQRRLRPWNLEVWKYAVFPWDSIDIWLLKLTNSLQFYQIVSLSNSVYLLRIIYYPWFYVCMQTGGKKKELLQNQCHEESNSYVIIIILMTFAHGFFHADLPTFYSTFSGHFLSTLVFLQLVELCENRYFVLVQSVRLDWKRSRREKPLV
jgi:hypothetical protein